MFWNLKSIVEAIKHLPKAKRYNAFVLAVMLSFVLALLNLILTFMLITSTK